MVGVVTPTGVAASELDDVLIADLATAQELTGSVGTLDRIDAVLDADADVRALTAALPPGLSLRSTSQQAGALGQLIQSYRLNLSALSLMASFVAVFIVYNSMLISVQQRATSLGILRCLGASRRQLGGLYVAEAMLYAAAGGAAGVVGGWGLAHVLLSYVSTTINDLYTSVRPAPVHLDGLMWAKGMGVSVGSCLVGALVPLVRASRTPPVNAFRGADRQRAAGPVSLALAAVGVALLGLSYVAWKLPGESPLAGFVMAFLVAVGFALTCPWATRAGCQLVAWAARPMQQVPLQMAAAGVGRSLGITGVAVAATMLAMGMNIGIRTMVSSFRTSLDSWMGRRFAADVFVGPELTVDHRADATLDPAVAAWVARQPAGRPRDRLPGRRHARSAAGRPCSSGTDVADVLRTLPMKYVAPGGRPFDPAGDALVSEPLAGRTHAAAGDTVTVDSPTGPHAFHVWGVFYDFGTERGQLMLDRHTYAADWRDDRVHVPARDARRPAPTATPWPRRGRRTCGRCTRSWCDSFDGVTRAGDDGVRPHVPRDGGADVAERRRRLLRAGRVAAGPGAGPPPRLQPAGRGRHERPAAGGVGAGPGAADRLGVGRRRPGGRDGPGVRAGVRDPVPQLRVEHPDPHAAAVLGRELRPGHGGGGVRGRVPDLAAPVDAAGGELAIGVGEGPPIAPVRGRGTKRLNHRLHRFHRGRRR